MLKLKTLKCLEYNPNNESYDRRKNQWSERHQKLTKKERVTSNYPFLSRKQSPGFTGKHTATSVLSQTDCHEDERRIRSLAVPNKTTMC